MVTLFGEGRGGEGRWEAGRGEDEFVVVLMMLIMQKKTIP